jgi:hypothetical protein
VKADRELAELERAVRRTTRWVSGLLVLFLVLLAGGVGFAWWQARQLLEPDRLVTEAGQQIRAHYPDIREDVKERVAASAPALARRASRKALANLPEVRVEVQKQLERQIEAGLDRGEVLSEQALRQFLQEHRDMIREGLDRVRAAPEYAPVFAARLERAIDKRLGSNLHRDARAGLDLLRQVNAKLKRLADNRDLTPSEQVELRMVRLLRAAQVRALAGAGARPGARKKGGKGP